MVLLAIILKKFEVHTRPGGTNSTRVALYGTILVLNTCEEEEVICLLNFTSNLLGFKGYGN